MKNELQRMFEDIVFSRLPGVGDEYKPDPTSKEYCRGCGVKKPVGEHCPHGCRKVNEKGTVI